MKRTALAAVLCAASLGSAWAIDIDAFSGRFGVAIINNASGEGAPSPVVNTLGGSVVIPVFVKGFYLSLQPALDLYWTNYEWSVDRAVPTESEHGGGNNAFVLGFILDLPVTATFRFNERIGGAASVGPSFVLRAAFANDDGVDMDANLSSIVSYLWGSGRWFYPSASLRMDVYLQENFTFAFGIRGSLPIFNLWTDSASFFDESILHITMAMLVGLN